MAPQDMQFAYVYIDSENVDKMAAALPCEFTMTGMTGRSSSAAGEVIVAPPSDMITSTRSTHETSSIAVLYYSL